MERKTVRSGIAGAGFAANFHYESIMRVYGTQAEVLGVYSPMPDGDAFAEQRGIKSFDSMEQMIDAVDVVHVCAPPSTHEKIAVAALAQDKSAIVEKPFTGYFGDGSETFDGDTFPRQDALDNALESVDRMLDAEEKSRGRICYAENWVYAPSVQKEREVIEKTGAQILWIHGEESHSGSHSPTYGIWKFSGGGSLMGKGCHPLTAALYLKCVEGRARHGKPIRPKSVSARLHSITRLPDFVDKGHMRTDYTDVEDYSMTHIVFDDGTVADVFSTEIVLGGVHNWLEVSANNHRTICNINPNTSMATYNPVDENFEDIYIVEKTGTKQGWSNPSPDEDWFTGYPQEMDAFYRAIAYGDPIESDSRLAADTISTMYSAYMSAEQGGADVGVKVF